MNGEPINRTLGKHLIVRILIKAKKSKIERNKKSTAFLKIIKIFSE